MFYATQSRRKGFTLIELLVVISIIGVLASIVLASLNSARQKAKNASKFATLDQFEKALQLYWTDNNGLYPNITPGAGWACIGNYSDNMCYINTTSYDVDPGFNNTMQPYFNVSRPDMSNANSRPIEGAMYYPRNDVGRPARSGYEIIFVLDGYQQSCGNAYTRGTTQGYGGYTLCTLCVNYSGPSDPTTNYCRNR